jgi:hypothetical protein
VRPPKVVAGPALIAALVAVAVPSMAGSGAHIELALDPNLFEPVEVASREHGSVTMTFAPEPGLRSDGALHPDALMLEPAPEIEPPEARPQQPEPTPGSVRRNIWRYDSNVSFYGPGFYGKRTACGLAYTREIMGVAHRSLPCGTNIQFRFQGRVITVPVIDRGPYVPGRTWDLSGAACQALDHCWSGPIEWRYGPRN